MSRQGNSPKVTRTRFQAQSTDPVNPQEGDVFRSDGTLRSEGLWEYRQGDWRFLAPQTEGLIQGDNATFDGSIGDWRAYSDLSETIEVNPVQAGNIPLSFTPASNSQQGNTFTTISGGTLLAIDLNLAYTTSAVTGDVVLDIYNTSVGAPTGSPIATSDNLDISVLTASLTTQTFNFSTPLSLSAATVYHFSLRNGTNTPSGSINLERNTAGLYGAGNLYSFDGVSFTSVPAHDVTPFQVRVAGTGSSLPIDGTGGAPTVTVTRTTSSPLKGSGSFLMTKDATNRQGEGGSLQDLPVDPQYRGQPTKLSFSYEPSSGYDRGSAADPVGNPSDVAVFFLDVTNNKLLTPASNGLHGENYWDGVIQIPTNCVSLRPILHITTTNSVAWTIKADSFKLDLALNETIKSSSDWIDYTPTFTGFGTATNVSARYKVNGPNIDVECTWTTGSPTASEARISLPEGYVSSSDLETLEIAGIFGRSASTANNGGFVVKEPSVSYFTFSSSSVFGSTTNGGLEKVNGNQMVASGQDFFFTATVPIEGLTSGVVHPASIGLNAKAVFSANTSTTTASTSTPFQYSQIEEDSLNGYSAGVYTVQKPGNYAILANAYSTTSFSLAIYVNGSEVSRGTQGTSATVRVNHELAVNLTYGDTIEIRPSASVTASGGATFNRLHIWEISSQQQPYAPRIVRFQNVQTSGTNGGAATTGSFATLIVNRQLGDKSFSSLSSNEITLQPGKYDIEFEKSFENVNSVKTRIFNVTDSVVLLDNDGFDCLSTTNYSNTSANDSTTWSKIRRTITLSSATTIRFEHRANAAGGTVALGRAASFGEEIYLDLKITKVL